VLAGPKAREVLAKVTDADLSNEAFPWLTGQEIQVGVAPVRALRVNFVGELGWELHHPLPYQNAIWDALIEAGAEFDISPFGIRAMDSLRIEKSYRYWRSDLTTECSAFEAGLDRFVQLNKGPFPGREALIAQQQAGVPQRFVTLEVTVGDADPFGNEPVYSGGRMVGRTTSGAYGYTLGKSMALAYVKTAHAAPGTALEVEILGERFPAKIIEESPWDPENARLRA
jgi:dimethylglycine dehydrogenase